MVNKLIVFFDLVGASFWYFVWITEGSIFAFLFFAVMIDLYFTEGRTRGERETPQR